MNALDAYKLWIPGELEYAATKRGSTYGGRIERARLGNGDGSMYDFLGKEWHHAQLLRSQGMHYAPNHQKTAQLQFAKFAAGFFDKLGVIHWVKDKSPATTEAFAESAGTAAAVVLEVEPWSLFDSHDFDAAEELDKPFAETEFSSGLLLFQEGITTFADTKRPSTLQIEDISTQALLLGGRATLCYLEYATTNLTPDQYLIPVSQHVA
jgi:hypothetical protein